MTPVAALFHGEHGYEELALRLREVARRILRGLALALLVLALLRGLLLLRLLAWNHALGTCLRHALGLRLTRLRDVLLGLLLLR